MVIQPTTSGFRASRPEKSRRGRGAAVGSGGASGCGSGAGAAAGGRWFCRACSSSRAGSIMSTAARQAAASPTARAPANSKNFFKG